jgi:hypothetical protein
MSDKQSIIYHKGNSHIVEKKREYHSGPIYNIVSSKGVKISFKNFASLPTFININIINNINKNEINKIKYFGVDGNNHPICDKVRLQKIKTDESCQIYQINQNTFKIYNLQRKYILKVEFAGIYSNSFSYHGNKKSSTLLKETKLSKNIINFEDEDDDKNEVEDENDKDEDDEIEDDEDENYMQIIDNNNYMTHKTYILKLKRKKVIAEEDEDEEEDENNNYMLDETNNNNNLPIMINNNSPINNNIMPNETNNNNSPINNNIMPNETNNNNSPINNNIMPNETNNNNSPINNNNYIPIMTNNNSPIIPINNLPSITNMIDYKQINTRVYNYLINKSSNEVQKIIYKLGNILTNIDIIDPIYFIHSEMLDDFLIKIYNKLLDKQEVINLFKNMSFILENLEDIIDYKRSNNTDIDICDRNKMMDKLIERSVKKINLFLGDKFGKLFIYLNILYPGCLDVIISKDVNEIFSNLIK